MDFDLLIVGMGPVGATAANLAGMWGLKTLAVDKMLDIYDKPRAFGLDHEVMRVFGNIGMCQGIRDAANLVWKLALVNKGLASQDLLDTYQEERIAHVRKTTLVTKELGLVICERDPAKAAERDARMIAKMAQCAGPTIRQSLIPGLTCGLLAPDDAADVRGALFPQPLVENFGGKEGLLDAFTGMKFRVVVAPGADLDALQEEIDSWASESDTPLVLVKLVDDKAPPTHLRIPGKAGSPAQLVSPTPLRSRARAAGSLCLRRRQVGGGRHGLAQVAAAGARRTRKPKEDPCGRAGDGLMPFPARHAHAKMSSICIFYDFTHKIEMSSA